MYASNCKFPWENVRCDVIVVVVVVRTVPEHLLLHLLFSSISFAVSGVVYVCVRLIFFVRSIVFLSVFIYSARWPWPNCERENAKTWNSAKSYLSLVGVCLFNVRMEEGWVGLNANSKCLQVIENETNKSLSFPRASTRTRSQLLIAHANTNIRIHSNKNQERLLFWINILSYPRKTKSTWSQIKRSIAVTSNAQYEKRKNNTNNTAQNHTYTYARISQTHSDAPRK